MNTKTKLIACLTLLSCTISWNCNQDETKFWYVPDEDKGFGAYNIGSYWIYQNDSTLQIDSVYVYALKNEPNAHQSDGDITDVYESLVSASHSSFDTNVRILYVLTAYSDTRLHNSFYYCCDTVHTTLSVEASIINWTNPIHLNSNYQSIQPSSIQINGNTFNSTFKLKVDSIQGLFGGPDIEYAEIYLTKDVGITKRIVKYIPDSTASWSLLRYHVTR